MPADVVFCPGFEKIAARLSIRRQAVRRHDRNGPLAPQTTERAHEDHRVREGE
jgi:hypothetical protein